MTSSIKHLSITSTLLILACTSALAQTIAPIRFIVPFPPGGAADQTARIVAQEASAILGTPIVVENKAGAGGMIAGDFVVRSKPDGKTFFVGANAPLVLNMGLYAKMPYDPEKDLIPVAGLGKSPLLLVTRKDLGVVSLKELLALAKKTPGKLTMGSAGSGNITHVGGEFVNSKMGIEVKHIPFAGSAPAILSMMGGHVDIMFDALPSSMQHAKAGKIQAIAIVDTQRFAQLPDVPTLVESGFPVAEASAWIVLMAPAQTPAAVVEEMNRAVNTALKKPDVIEKLQGIGEQPMPGTAQDLGKFIASERSRWIPLIRTLGLKAD